MKQKLDGQQNSSVIVFSDSCIFINEDGSLQRSPASVVLVADTTDLDGSSAIAIVEGSSASFVYDPGTNWNKMSKARWLEENAPF